MRFPGLFCLCYLFFLFCLLELSTHSIFCLALRERRDGARRWQHEKLAMSVVTRASMEEEVEGKTAICIPR
jgi:hypothetical protein